MDFREIDGRLLEHVAAPVPAVQQKAHEIADW